ncbi:hypothetical protein Ddye_030023 [Dipteronia dyeriana]|uniref:Uncharacterized protein n=1 Tax=Dipteronia dyeriana TaxID=168575 RepID=A0AAD9TFW3_9ROSI|nr:hypothetical protein Ddye_030023 [Dipteronia dyeriana]
MAFTVKTDVAKSGGYNSQKPQNSNSSASKNKKRDGPYCTHCKILGHTMDRCYKIHGYPLRYKTRSNNNSNATTHQVLLLMIDQEKFRDKIWERDLKRNGDFAKA